MATSRASSVTPATSVTESSSVTEASSVADVGGVSNVPAKLGDAPGRIQLPDDHPQVLGAKAPPPSPEAYLPPPSDKTLLADVMRKDRAARQKAAQKAEKDSQ
jgi:hypothetical protein